MARTLAPAAERLLKSALRTRRGLRWIIANDPEANTELLAKVCEELTRQIEHLRAGKGPPAPPTPAFDFLMAGHETEEALRIVAWSARQRAVNVMAQKAANASGGAGDNQ